MTSLMPHLSGTWRSLLAALVLLPAPLFAATGIYVAPAPAGNDANPGTALQPVATPQGAQVRVRALIAAGLTNPVEVIFAAGTYEISAPLELRPEDSGTAAFPITWKAATNGTVILSGGKKITGTWTNGGGGIWFTDLTGVGLGPNQWNFRQLFVNGQRATRARYPNVTQSNPFLYATGGNTNYVIINSNLVKSSWGTAADAQINIVPQSRFFNQWNTVTGVNTNTGRINLANSELNRLIDSGSWFWIEGVQAELDEPNEWFLNPTTGRLSYMPTNGVDPNTLEIVAPYLNRIINVQGDVNAGTHVQYVNFDGLEFRYTDFTLGQIEARVATDTAIMFENTSDSSVRNCRFVNIGGYALWLHLDSQRNVFDQNTVSYSGAGGVLLTGSRLAYMDDSKIYTPGEAAAKVAPILNEITRNTVEHCGKIRYYGGGVHLDSRPFSMTMAPGNYIAHNHFNDLSRNGIFAFRNQGGNVVEYNRIHNCMQTTIDGAAIHFATMNTINAPNYILNNYLYDIWGWSQKSNGIPTRSLGNGVFLDWDTSNTTVKDNWVYNSVSGAVKVIFGGNQNVVQSGNQSSSTVITPPFEAEVGPDGTASYGIVLASNQLTGSVIAYTDTEHFSSNGTWAVETAIGIVNLFEFKYLTGTAAVASQAIYTLPITEDGNYQISLLYKPGSDRASNVPITIKHADGITNITWNMQQGSQYGFAVAVGTFRFVASQTNTVTLSTTNVNGKVIADSVGFVKIENNVAPVVTNVQVSGSAQVGGTLTGSYNYSDANNDLESASRFQWYRSTDANFGNGDVAIPGATNQSYVVQSADTGNFLFFEVTPVALTGVSPGSVAQSAPVYIFQTAGFIRKLGSGLPQRIVFYGTSLTASGIWTSQMQSAVDSVYPGLVTYINSGGSGKASDWGVTNLQTKVINQTPDVVFIEFSVNDAAVILNVSRAQALANLSTMVNSIRSARPNCEIILQVMNPVDRRDTDTYSPRTDLAFYQQDYRNFAATNGLQFIDHMPAFQALLDEGSDAYRVFVPDGLHPNAEGFARYLTPVLLQAIGLAPDISPQPDIVLDNSDPAPAIVLNGAWTSSTNTPGYLGTDYLQNGNTGQGTKSAVFTPNIPSNGVYPLFLRWTSDVNRATNVPVTVNYNGGSSNRTVNQTLNGGTWFALGSFPFAAGTNGTVTIGTTATSGYVIVDGMGVGLSQTSTVVRLRMDNGRAAEPSAPQAVGRSSTLIVWRSGSTQADLTVQLSFTGGSAVSGVDYAMLPTSLTIPAGQSAAAVQLLPWYDLLVEGDETFKVSLVPAAGYSTGYPSKASIVIEDRVGSGNAPPVASNVTITGTPAVGATIQGNYNYSDSEGDAESGTTFQWFRSDDAIFDAGDVAIPGATNRSYTVQAADSGKTLFFQVTPMAATGSLTGSPAASGGVLIPTAPPSSFKILIKEDFGGTGAALNGTPADTFDTAITAAGGSSNWVAAANFLDNGAVTLATRQAAYFNLGNYINNAKGSAAGFFKLTL
ncbi:MAG: right-handed parallel beta-helix repeat-containing protein, partial [Verrucomicrobia bacterium]|nr:right-handed parallel beta-helix repeat-containing protein [Verrucomicrobiota bacterium]